MDVLTWERDVNKKGGGGNYADIVSPSFPHWCCN